MRLPRKGRAMWLRMVPYGEPVFHQDLEKKKTSKQSEGDTTDSSPRLPGTCRTAHLPTLTLGKAM